MEDLIGDLFCVVDETRVPLEFIGDANVRTFFVSLRPSEVHEVICDTRLSVSHSNCPSVAHGGISPRAHAATAQKSTEQSRS